MKLKNKMTLKQLRHRLKFSIVMGVLFVLVFILMISWIRKSSEDGAYSLHRESFKLNEKLWSLLQSSKRESVTKPTPAKGKVPRVNGSIGLKSPIDLAHYKIHVESGNQEIHLTPTDFHLLPKVSYSTDFRCIEGWSEELQYAGARFSDFMKAYRVGKKTDGSYYEYVGLETPDREYYVSIDMKSMLHPQTILAYEMNLAPLKPENGLPLRLIIPIKYGIKSLKRIGKIFFSDQRPPD